MTLQPVIGLEIHVQLKTESKMFCSCSNKGEFAAPNTTICAICLGHPGTLPVINARAVEFGLRVGRALGGRVTERSKFDRKHYFYPDLPKGYQISQFDLPIIRGGEVLARVKRDDGTERELAVRIHRIHLEEDAAKLHHGADGVSSLVDFNRAGTPLIEIVTEADMRSPQEAKAFLQELRLTLRYLGVSEADMEKGHLRCDANISLREVPEDPTDGSWALKFNPKTEVKNINSFRSVERALEYEIKRQTKLWLDGKPVSYQSTRGWDDVRQLTVEQRTKEDAADYRFFPEPDLPPMLLEDLHRSMPESSRELPEARRQRLMAEYGFSRADAVTMCDDKSLADYAEHAMSELAEWTSVSAENRDAIARLVSGWLLTKLNGVLTERKLTIETQKATPENFAELIALIHEKKVTGTNALVILDEMATTGADPSIILEEKNLGLLEDFGELEMIAKNIVAANPKALEDYRAGKTNAVQWLVGQMMKTTKGKAPPEEARRLIEAELGKS